MKKKRRGTCGSRASLFGRTAPHLMWQVRHIALWMLLTRSLFAIDFADQAAPPTWASWQEPHSTLSAANVRMPFVNTRGLPGVPGG